MKTKHTPGPWKHKFVAGAFRITPASEPGIGYVPAVAQVHVHSRPGEPLDPHCEGNARLIAAAPEMADLLRDIVRLGDSGVAVNEAHYLSARAILAEIDNA